MSGIQFLGEISTIEAILWYYVGLLGVLAIYAYSRVPKDELSLRKWVVSNRMRLYVGTGIAVLFSVAMFAPDISEFIISVIKIQTSFLTPLVLGGGVGGLLIAGFKGSVT